MSLPWDEAREQFGQHVPLPASEFGLKMFIRGQALVRAGTLPAHIMWDADEILWDWTMSAQSMVRELPATLRHRELTHSEAFQIKPGALELLWGMRLQALASGQDARVRIWTNGYAWRLWAIAQHVPGFATLLGLDEGESWEHFEEAPNIFCRSDYVRAVEPLFSTTKRMMWLEQIPWRAREVIKEHLATNPYDSSFKVPEIAPLVGKVAFDQIKILIDDRWMNAQRFARTGRVAICVPAHPLRAFFSLVPNASWSQDELLALSPLGTAVMEKIADGLDQLDRLERGTVLSVSSQVLPFEYEPLRFKIEIPDGRIRQHWILPMDELRARHQGALERLNSNARALRHILPRIVRARRRLS